MPYEEVWGRIVAICYALLRGDDAEGLNSFLDQGFYVSFPLLSVIFLNQLSPSKSASWEQNDI